MNKQCKSCLWESQTGERVDSRLTIGQWAKKLNIGKSSVDRHLRHSSQVPTSTTPNHQSFLPGYRWEVGDEDFEGSSHAQEEQVTDNDVERFLRQKGLNPDEWEYQFRFSEWEQGSANGPLKTLHAFRVSGKRKKPSDSRKWEKEYVDLIAAFKPSSEPPVASECSPETFVVVPTDFQIGKVDLNGGTADTITQVLESFSKAAEYAKKHKPQEIVIIEAGDIVENIYSVSSQLGTNDLGLPHQVAIAYELMLKGIQMLAPLAPKIIYVTVPSNHGSHRIGPKSPAGNAHEDWGIMLAKILAVSAPLSPALKHLTVHIPKDHIESVALETSGTTLGVVHGHQASSSDRIGEWWARQTHGNMPTATARILVTGHWHSFRAQQSGDARWIFVGPASDRGSSWFTNSRGEQATSGMLAFKTSNNSWTDIQIL